MDLSLFQQLLAPEGQVALASAMQLRPTMSTFLRCFGKLSKSHSDALSKAALEMAMLRERAKVKFRLAEQMYFLREPLEQATREVIAGYRAERFREFARVADLCCGIGGDTLGLASVCPQVVAVDTNPLHLEMASQNLHVYQRHDRVSFLEADVLQHPFDAIDAFFCDPDRRSEGKRHLSLHDCHPSVNALLERAGATSSLAIKLAPGSSWSELEAYDAEAEFISFEGELKECVLWFGSLRQVARRATLLPGPHTLTAEKPAASPGTSTPLAYLYDPDPAIVRAGLVPNLADRLDAKLLDYDVAHLTSACHTPTPFAQPFAIEESLPFHVKRLRTLLRDRNVGSVIVHKRGSSTDVNVLIRQLKLKGDKHQHVVLTRVQGRPFVLLVRPE